MANTSDSQELVELRRQVSDWLLAEGWTVADFTAKAEGTAWAIEATDPRRRVVILGQQPDRPEVLILHAAIRVAESDQARLRALGLERGEQLAWDLRFQLLGMGLQFGGLALPLQQVVLVLRMYTDDLTRNGFFERLDRLQGGITACVWMIRRALDLPAPEEAPDGLGVN